YLEMTDTGAADYSRDRVPVVLDAGAARATWWENVNRDRTDLPRKLPEFSLLGVYEVDRAFTPPAASDDLLGTHLFDRTTRPRQRPPAPPARRCERALDGDDAAGRERRAAAGRPAGWRRCCRRAVYRRAHGSVVGGPCARAVVHDAPAPVPGGVGSCIRYLP